jgi:hypothetical protein
VWDPHTRGSAGRMTEAEPRVVDIALRGFLRLEICSALALLPPLGDDHTKIQWGGAGR